MSCLIERDPGADLARLKCDAGLCRRVSAIWLMGQPRITEPCLIRIWLRARCASAGWGQLPSLEDGQSVVMDLCPKCARRYARIL
jgi:hypothetical protein